MAKEAKSGGSYQSLGKGIYRVGAVTRSATTGRYVTKETTLAIRAGNGTVSKTTTQGGQKR